MVSSITADDGNGTTSTTSYSYSGGYHDIADREFRGFNYVKTTLSNQSTVESFFYNEDAVMKGLMYKQVTSDQYSVKYTELFNTYQDLESSPFAFPALVQTDASNYDGTNGAQQVRTSFGYDQYGNMQWKDSKGDLAVQGDERYEYTEYDYDVSNWLLSRPLISTIRQSCTGPDLARTAFTYWLGTNLVLTKTFWLAQKGAGEADPSVTYTYEYGNVKRQTDARNFTTVFTYDPTFTFVTVTENPKHHISQVSAYDYRYSKPLTKIDLNGNSTSYWYDVFGRLDRVAGPGDTSDYPTVRYDYQNFGTVGQQYVATYSRKESGSAAEYGKATYFDGLGREIWAHTTNVPAVWVSTAYDGNGKVSMKSLPYFSGSPPWVQFGYDAMGRLTSTTNPDGTTSTVSYSRDQTTFTDPKLNKKYQWKDVYGRIKTVRECLSSTECFDTYYSYDTLGNLTDVTDANWRQTHIVYDTLSRKREMLDPAMGHWLYTYDANGNLETQTDAKSKTIRFTYDELNRPLTKDYPTDPEVQPGILYQYDQPGFSNAIGRLTTVHDDLDEINPRYTTFNYDYAGRVTSSSTRIDGVIYTTRQTYNASGQITGITYPKIGNEADFTVTYAYHADGKLYQVSGGSSIYATYTQYTALGQPLQIQFGNGALTNFEYYPLKNRLHSMSTASNGAIQNFQYTYDDNGNIESIYDFTSSESQTFVYDGLNRLTTAIGSSYGTISLTFDRTGNIETNTGDGEDAGASQGRVYDYDNRLVSVDSGETAFVYNSQGARVKKTHGASTTTYIGKLYEVKDGTARKHIFAGGRRIATKIDGDNTYYYHPDHLGSLHVVTNSAGAEVQRITYYPFGVERSNSNPGLTKFPYRFTGQEFDFETGLYYYGARYYDPALARFITPDTIVQSPGDPQTLNRYAYCRNNPLVYTDPSGNDFIGFFIMGLVFAFGSSLPTLDPAEIFKSMAISGLAAGVGALAGAMAAPLTSVITQSVVRGAVIGAVAGFAGGAIAGD